MSAGYSLFKKMAFQLDPENVHDWCTSAFKQLPVLAKILPHINADKKYQLSDKSMIWNFPIGIAAGLDKNAQFYHFLANLGFGNVEVGTVTVLPQEGNPRPRIFRHPKINSLQNSMGFPNVGAEQIFKNIQANPPTMPLGVNIGKNKNTPEHEAWKDYATLYEKFAPLATYIAVNVSSPNTPGLRNFQQVDNLRPILEAVNEKRVRCHRPLYLKISPDMEQAQVNAIVDLAKELKLEGIMATNTTSDHQFGAGGLSGDYIREKAKTVRKWVCEAAREDKKLSVIGLGGVKNFDDLKEFWSQGGRFMQIYTSFIYHGPSILIDIQKDIDKALTQTGTKNLSEYVASLNP